MTRSQRAVGDDEQPPVVGVGADHDVDAGAGAAGDPVDRAPGEDVAVDHRLPGQRARDDLEAPAVRVGMGDQVRLELGRGQEQAIGRHRRDRLAGRRDAEPVRQISPDPQARSRPG